MLHTSRRVAWDYRTPDLASIRREIARVLKPFSLEAASSGQFDARVCHRQLLTSDVILIDYGNATLVDAGQMSRFYVLQIPLSGGYAFAVDGETRQVRQGEAHLIHPDVWLRMKCAANCRLLVLRIADRRLLEAERRCRTSAEYLRIGYVFPCNSGAGASLARVVDYCTSELMQGGLMPRDRALAAHAEELLLETLIQTLECLGGPARARRLAYVDAAEKYILEHLDSDLTIEDIERACKVHARTLFSGFRARHGASPIAWARTQRLHRVRAELIGPAGRELRVSDVALRWGFTHFGHFNVAYRRLHGEAPSETRRNGGASDQAF